MCCRTADVDIKGESRETRCSASIGLAGRIASLGLLPSEGCCLINSATERGKQREAIHSRENQWNGEGRAGPGGR